MVRIHPRKAAWSVALGAFGAAALLSAAPSASAEPAVPVPPPAPGVTAPLPLAAPAEPMAAPAPVDQPPAVVPHLSSLENLPPGATLAPTGPEQGPGMSYLRELWHAVQTQEVSKADAVLLLTQRPMSANTAPPAGLPAGPQPPANPDAPAPLPVAGPDVPAPLPVAPLPPPA